VASVENNHKNVPSARKGQEVCIKIESVPGEAPKMFGRHFDENDMLLSKVRSSNLIMIIIPKISPFLVRVRSFP
jgi:translation initiation factor 5B